MNVEVVPFDACKVVEEESCLVIPLFEKAFPLDSSLLNDKDEEFLQTLADKNIITGKAQTCYYAATPRSTYQGVLVVGLGPRDDYDDETWRRTGGKAVELLQLHRVSHVYLDLSRHDNVPPLPFLEGLVLGQYNFEVYKKAPEPGDAPVKIQTATVITDDKTEPTALLSSIQLGVLACLSANGARHLANTAPNEMTPRALADFAQGIADESGCKCTIMEPEEMERLGMNALLGVARGSAQPPRLIFLEHHHSDNVKTLAIVGKGITFDTGGISIKPAAGMHEMKYDMCGAAAVLCAFMTIAELKPAINVVAVVPAAENMTGDAAQRPGDIVKAYNGKTIEVHNTDAEGRLVLADAMAYTVDKYKPHAMVDAATLTGACVVALGHCAAGLFSNNPSLASALIAAGEATGERLWQLPLWKDYDKLIEGTHADICNVGPREGGAITAAAFLKNFVGDTPWAHIDIAGTAWDVKNTPYWNTNHATGFGVRLLTKWILDQVEE
ncbi:MAG: leucyl aminopeptidase [Candidatus Hydrogenedentes bacterium]|nr:leucyl aminopeptidase [Candidatus Hydrogenedentota bacterium]